VLLAVPLLFVVSALTFLLVSVTPGDAAREILGDNSTPEQYEQLRTTLGLDRPLYAQYGHWLGRAVHGDLGRSLITHEPVMHAISDRVSVTASLMLGALLANAVIGISLGVLSAVRGGAVGRFVDAMGLVGFALPAFWVAAVLITVFAVALRWFPATGYVRFDDSGSGWARSLVLPVAALTLHGVAAVAKQTREAMLDALASDYIRAARANGIRERSLVFRHALRNASVRSVTILGLQAIGLLGGTVLVESVFALPGLGGLVADASLQHDLPMVQGVVMAFAVMVVAINLVIDIVYAWIDPRVAAA
jgi:peptide/nickel transport system permease protein